MDLLDGKVIALTGAGRGIGRSVALLAAKEGARVVVNDAGVNPDGSGHDNGPAAQVAEEITKADGQAVANFADVSSMDGGESIIQQAVDAYGHLDGLVNLAAVLRDRMVFNMSEQEWDDVIRIDLKGHFTTIKPAAVLFRQQRSGRIVNFSSASGLGGNAGQANYAAAKAGIAGLTRSVARDLGRYGVTVNAIAPSAATRLTATVSPQARARRASSGVTGPTGDSAPTQTAEQVEAQRKAAEESGARSPDHVAAMVIYLLLDEAWNINAQTFSVGGGQIGLLPQLYPPIRQIFNAQGWSLEELRRTVPAQLTAGLQNPAPPPADLEVAGRA